MLPAGFIFLKEVAKFETALDLLSIVIEIIQSGLVSLY